MKLNPGKSSGHYRSDISSADLAATPSEFTYTGNPFTPAIMVTYDGTVLRPNEDYSVRYVNNVSVGSASAVVEGIGNYVGSATVTFTIKAVSVASTDLSNASVSIPTSTYTYTGSAITPTATVKLGSSTLTIGVDYNVSYASNTVVGTASMTISSISGGTYTGSKTVTFSIVPPSIANATVTLNATIFSYTGALVCPEPTVKITVGQILLTLVKDVDYEVSYSNNGARGTATATITGIGAYQGSKSVTFQIGKDLSSATIDILSNTYPYTGAAVDPEPVVTLAGTALVKGVDYTVSYTDNIDVGIGRVTITGAGDYIGSVSAPINIDNSENEAWESVVLSSGITTAIRSMRVPDTVINKWRYSTASTMAGYDLTFSRAAPLPDGGFMAVVGHNSVVSDNDGSVSRIARFKFSAGHAYDISTSTEGSTDGYDSQHYLSAPVDITPLRLGASDVVAEDTGYYSPYYQAPFSVADYGRKLVVPRGRYYMAFDSGGINYNGGHSFYPVSSEKDANGNLYLNRFGKCLVTCDLDTPYDLGTYGNEKVVYVHNGAGNNIYIGPAAFSSDGMKLIFSYYVSGQYTAPLVTLNLKSKFTLNSNEDVASQTTTLMRPIMESIGDTSGHQIKAMQFSPDGKHLALCTGQSNYFSAVLLHLQTAWDVSSVTSGSSTAGAVFVATDGVTKVYDYVHPFFLFLPKYKKILLAAGNGSNSSEHYHSIYEYRLS